MKSVRLTGYKETTVDVDQLPDGAEFFKYQRQVCPNEKQVVSHLVIDKYINKFGEDYRYEVKDSQEKTLRDRSKDNTELGRKKGV